ncbi:MAG: peroxiredoxin [Bryobacteraceae bacterium]
MLDWLLGGPLPTGGRAPDFTLPDEAGNEVSLAALRGRNVVLVFYPGDETTICRRQLCELRDRWDWIRDRNIAVFGVNPQSPESHARFRSNQKLPFPLLVDEGQKVAALYKAGGIVVRRTVYVIGPDGTIRYGKRGKPSSGEILASVQPKP